MSTTALRQGSTLLSWPRGAVAVSQTLRPVVLGALDGATAAALLDGDAGRLGGALGEHGTTGEPSCDDPVLRERLADLDEMYAGWIPGFLAGESARLAAVAAMHARRRVVPPPRGARPALPCSTVRVARAIAATGAQQIFLDDDVDGSSILLAADAEVTVVEPDGLRRLWLQREAEYAGVGGRLTVVANSDDLGDGDAAVVSIGPPQLTAASLTWACDRVRPGGTIFATLRAPWEDGFLKQLEPTGLILRDHYREIYAPVLPGGYVLDGAGDLVVLERTPDARIPEAPAGAAAAARAQPYYWLDFDELDAARMGSGALETFIDTLAAQVGATETMRSVLREEDRELVTWFGGDGIGITAELTRRERHLLVTMMPYDLGVEYAVLCAACHTLGDGLTRVRPQLTTRWHQESIVG